MQKHRALAYAEEQLSRAFSTWARSRGGKSEKLGISGGKLPEMLGPDRDASSEIRVKLAVTPEQLQSLHDAADARGMPTAAWIRSLALAHAERRPQWGPFEWQAFRDVITILNRVDANVSELAQQAMTAVRQGEAPLAAARDARKAAEAAERAISRLGWMMNSDLEYWGAEAGAKPTARRVPAPRTALPLAA